MSLTFKSARFANAEHTAAEALTEEVGSVLISEVDTPDLWADLQAWGEPSPYAPPAAAVPRSVAMWRARTIMKITPWSGGTLFQAVQEKIADLTDPLQKAAAEEALERGDVFDRDGVFVPLLAQLVGVDEPTLDTLMQRAAALPA